MNDDLRLAPEALYTACDPDSLEFATTAELPDAEILLGQRRARDAIRFGVRMRSDGFNVFALGPSGVGKSTAIRRIIETDVLTLGTTDAQGAFFIGITTKGNRIVEALLFVLTQMVRAVGADIDADLGHHLHRPGVESMRFGAGRVGLNLPGEILINDAIGHLAATGVTGA